MLLAFNSLAQAEIVEAPPWDDGDINKLTRRGYLCIGKKTCILCDETTCDIRTCDKNGKNCKKSSKSMLPTRMRTPQLFRASTKIETFTRASSKTFIVNLKKHLKNTFSVQLNGLDKILVVINGTDGRFIKSKLVRNSQAFSFLPPEKGDCLITLSLDHRAIGTAKLMTKSSRRIDAPGSGGTVGGLFTPNN